MSSDSTPPVDVSPASEILQTISPPVLATLLAFREREQKTQEEIASEVGCARSTISKYVQTLLNLPINVLEKNGHRITVTSAGHTLIDLYRDSLAECNIDIESVDWGSDEATRVEEALSPLFRFRSNSPYLILDGIYELDQQTAEGEEVWEDDLLMEIDRRNPSTIDSISSQHFEQVLDKFVSHNVLERDDDTLSLTEKGRALGNLSRQIQLTFGENGEDRDTSHAFDTPTAGGGIAVGRQHIDHSAEGVQDVSSSTAALDSQSPVSTKSIGTPDSANAFRGRISGHGKGPTPRLGPVICVRRAGDVQPVGSVEGGTVAEVVTKLRALATKLEEFETAEDELQVGVLRSLVRGDQVKPLGNDWQDLSDASFAEWQMINKAMELVSNEP